MPVLDGAMENALVLVEWGVVKGANVQVLGRAKLFNVFVPVATMDVGREVGEVWVVVSVVEDGTRSEVVVEDDKASEVEDSEEVVDGVVVLEGNKLVD